jgi:hypothetical protein
MREFSFKSTIEEFKINGEVYSIDFADDKVKEYQKTFRSFYDKAMEFQKAINKDVNTTDEEQEEMLEKSKQMTKEIIDSLLGKNKFEIIYEQSGRSLMNVLELVSFLGDVVKEKTEKLTTSHVNKYLGNKNMQQNKNNSRPKHNAKFNRKD